MKETYKNLVRAIAGESMARNKYTYFASQAKKEGYEQIAAIFTETADNEKEHASRLMKLLDGATEADLAQFDFPIVGKTIDNLIVAAKGEKHEWSQMYPDFETVARNESLLEIADVFKEIGEVEEEHEKRYLKLADNIKKGIVFKRDKSVKWHCRNCGYVHEGKEAPQECPACAHAQAFYELLAENY
ncbi:MAG: rubrerythrin family protein [Patescibacteria group bacterium]|nr:rubrerythrin family protein [Patescibacteria group bacterium]